MVVQQTYPAANVVQAYPGNVVVVNQQRPPGMYTQYGSNQGLVLAISTQFTHTLLLYKVTCLCSDLPLQRKYNHCTTEKTIRIWIRSSLVLVKDDDVFKCIPDTTVYSRSLIDVPRHVVIN